MPAQGIIYTFPSLTTRCSTINWNLPYRWLTYNEEPIRHVFLLHRESHKRADLALPEFSFQDTMLFPVKGASYMRSKLFAQARALMSVVEIIRIPQVGSNRRELVISSQAFRPNCMIGYIQYAGSDWIRYYDRNKRYECSDKCSSGCYYSCHKVSLTS